ncbi:MAG TPA: hypothetical protein VGO58_09185 [Chitinophagaceae bacterium]|jgi:hypothetical protein|nr:hypothetical protein [Chitinophagaceae bacterium]
MIALNSREIELFKNLSQFEMSKAYYDFHNDFNCIKIIFENTSLILVFRNIPDNHFVLFKFEKVILESFEFFNFEELKNLTIDTIYRGRFQKGNELLEFDIDGKAYFYIEFYEGPKIELWCEKIIIEESEKEEPVLSSLLNK